MEEKFTLTYQELFNLIQKSYKQGYCDYETIEAGLEGYDPESYVRYIITQLSQKNIK
jgi:hypothetical protein